MLGVWPGWGFGGRQSRAVIRDWARTARTGRYPALAGVDMEAALPGVRLPVLAVDMETDQYTPAPTVDFLTAKLSGRDGHPPHYSAAEAGSPIDHFTWARHGAPLAARVATWATPPDAPQRPLPHTPARRAPAALLRRRPPPRNSGPRRAAADRASRQVSRSHQSHSAFSPCTATRRRSRQLLAAPGSAAADRASRQVSRSHRSHSAFSPRTPGRA